MESMSVLKSSLTKKDSKLNSSANVLYSRKEVYFLLERKNADISHSYDKRLAKFDAYYKVAERSKSEAVIEAYKLGYLDCKSGAVPCHSIEDEDVEMLCPDIEATEEHLANEVAGKEEDAKEGTTDEVAADLAEQMVASNEQVVVLGEVMEGAVDQVEVEEIIGQYMETHLFFQAL